MNKKAMIALMISIFLLSGCVSIPKETVELSDVTAQQITELHKSHIRFVELYYGKLRDDVNSFIDNKWVPLFLSKAVDHQAFREDLDAAYITSNIHDSDITLKWKGKELAEPQKSVLLNGVKQVVTDEKGKLGKTLLEWSEEAQYQINKKRQELIAPIDVQEKMVINEINGAFLDLQRSQAAIKGYLAAAVDLKETGDEVLRKLGALEKIENVMNAVMDANDKITAILEAKDEGEKAIDDFYTQMKASTDSIKTALKISTNEEK